MASGFPDPTGQVVGATQPPDSQLTGPRFPGLHCTSSGNSPKAPPSKFRGSTQNLRFPCLQETESAKQRLVCDLTDDLKRSLGVPDELNVP